MFAEPLALSPLSSIALQADGKTALHLTVSIPEFDGYYSVLPIVDFLAQNLGTGLNKQTLSGNTALHICAETGGVECMKLLLRSKAKTDIGADCFLPFRTKRTALTALLCFRVFVECLVGQRKFAGLRYLLCSDELFSTRSLTGKYKISKYRLGQGPSLSPSFRCP